MSLLEDVFLQDEANEAHELERIIEGDEEDERRRSRSDSDDNSVREDEAEEEKKRVDPTSAKTKRVIKNPRFILNPARLTGPRGVQVIPDHFKDFKFKGKGHEKEDLDIVLKRLEHWAYRLYPKFKFEDCLKKIETLGKKRPVMVHLQKIRTDQYISEETVVQKDSSDDEAPQDEPPPEDEFDKLLQQQIDLARSTPAPGSVKKGMDSTVKENRSIIMPKAISSPSINDEQRERILKSRKVAEERRLARLKNASHISINSSQKDSEGITTRNNNSHSDNTVLNGNEVDNKRYSTENVIDIDENNLEVVKKINRTNVIDSSDEEGGVVLLNESITVDIHSHFSNKTDSTHDNNEQASDEKQTHNEIENEEKILEIADHCHNGKGDDRDVIVMEKEASDHVTTESELDIRTSESNCQNKTKVIENDNVVEQRQDGKSNDIVVEILEKSVVNNVEDLMDVDFDDDF